MSHTPPMSLLGGHQPSAMQSTQVPLLIHPLGDFVRSPSASSEAFVLSPRGAEGSGPSQAAHYHRQPSSHKTGSRHASSHQPNETNRLHPYRRSHHQPGLASESGHLRSSSSASGSKGLGLQLFVDDDDTDTGAIYNNSEILMSPSSESDNDIECLMEDGGDGFALSPLQDEVEPNEPNINVHQSFHLPQQSKQDSGFLNPNSFHTGLGLSSHQLHQQMQMNALLQQQQHLQQQHLQQQQQQHQYQQHSQMLMYQQQRMQQMQLLQQQHQRQSDPQKVQDAEDLASFAAWVTLRLLERRWSLLQEQNAAGKSASVSTLPTAGASSIRQSPLVPAHAQSAILPQQGPASAGPNGKRPLLNRYQASKQRDSVATFNSLGSTAVGADSYYRGSSSLLSVKDSSSFLHFKSQSSGSTASVTFKSPEGSPLMGQQEFASSPISESIHQPHPLSHYKPQGLPPIMQSVDTLRTSTNTPSSSLYHGFSQSQHSTASSTSQSLMKASYNNQASISSATNIPQQIHSPHPVAMPPQPSKQPLKHSLPPAYVSHYASKLTRLTQLTLLRAPTPPQTILLALHLLRRLISTPRSLPTRITTPTRMLLGCLMVADSVFGSERGVASRDWKAIAQYCGLREDDQAGASTNDGLGFIAGIKKDVLVFLDFNLEPSFKGYSDWLGVLKDFLKEQNGAVVDDRRRRTRQILEDLEKADPDGEGRISMGWKW
ncbi:hypothetical protein BDR26DRAFT_858135 [Obelidium mucronatum]|nr:hypothetical protein BDR26DRAFT_858135 [Obelidium mucronatum]